MGKKKFIPALGYNWLSGLYDLTIKLTMPEKKFRNKLIEYLNPQSNEMILDIWFWYSTKSYFRKK
jgi:hypothetical protein